MNSDEDKTREESSQDYSTFFDQDATSRGETNHAGKKKDRAGAKRAGSCDVSASEVKAGQLETNDNSLGQDAAGQRALSVYSVSSNLTDTERRTLSSKWLKSFAELEQYKATNGNCEVTQKVKPLGLWVNKQRSEKAKWEDGKDSQMSDLKMRLLESVGFKWAKRKGSISWNERYNQLVAYKEKEGDCNVPTRSSDSSEIKVLGRWVTSQRSLYKRGVIDKEKIKRLEEIGFTWSRFD